MTKDKLRDKYDMRAVNSARNYNYSDYLENPTEFNQLIEKIITSADDTQKFDLAIRIFFDTCKIPAIKSNHDTFAFISQYITQANLDDTAYFIYYLLNRIRSFLPLGTELMHDDFINEAKYNASCGQPVTWNSLGSMDQYGIPLACIAMKDFTPIFSHALELLNTTEEAQSYVELIHDFLPVDGIVEFFLRTIGNHVFHNFAKEIDAKHKEICGCQMSLGTIGSGN